MPGELPSGIVFVDNQATTIQGSDPLLEHIDIVIDISGSISGCLKWTDSQPIPDIWVSAWSEMLEYGNAAMSGLNGCYTITGLLPVSENMAYTNGYTVEIVSDALPGMAYAQGMRVAAPANDIDFQIDNQIAISGQVVDQLGNGLENIPVMAWSIQDDSKTGNALSDINGRYSLINLAPAEDYLVAIFPDDLPMQYYNQVSDPNLASTIIVDDILVKDINFVLDQKAQINGRVYLDDQIAGAGLWLDIVSAGQPFQKSVQTKAQGEYAFIGLDPDVTDYRIHMAYPGYVTYQSSELAPTDAPYTINLQKGLTLRGSILANNSSVDHAGILLQSDAGLKYVAQSNLSSPFNYTFSGLLPGTYHITISHDAYETQELNNIILYADMDYLDFYLLRPTHTISGMVLGLNLGHKVLLNAWSEMIHTQNFVNITG